MLNLVLPVTPMPPAWVAARACSAISARRLLAPITLVGRTSLSVLMSTKSLTPFSAAAWAVRSVPRTLFRSEEHTSELQSLMRISYAVFCLKKKKQHNHQNHIDEHNKKNQDPPHQNRTPIKPSHQ